MIEQKGSVECCAEGGTVGVCAAVAQGFAVFGYGLVSAASF
jgi:hypothetical protein